MNAELAPSVKTWLDLFDQAVEADASNAQHCKMLQRRNEADKAAKHMDEGINEPAEKKRQTSRRQEMEDWDLVWIAHTERWEQEKFHPHLRGAQPKRRQYVGVDCDIAVPMH